MITAVIRIKGSDSTRHDTRKRSFKNFDPVVYRQKLEEVNWVDIYEIEDTDLAYDFLESNVVKILDEMCPFRTVQFRSKHKPWLTDDTKDMMSIRDDTREMSKTHEG